MPTEPDPLTLSEVVRRAVEVCDDGSPSLEDLLVRFEDAEEPVAAVPDIGGLLDERLGPAEADEGEAPLTMARAVVAYLAHRRDQIDTPQVELLRLASRAEFHGQPPDYVARWLVEQGVEAH